MADIYILYPERRWISAQKLASWYYDAVDNGEANPGATTIDEMAAELETAGHITRAAAPAIQCQGAAYDEFSEGTMFERAIGDGNDLGG